MREWFATNADRYKEYKRQYIEANADAVRQRKRTYRETHKDAIRAQKRQYREAHADHRRDAGRKWRASNPDKAKMTASRYMARKRGLPDTLSGIDWQAALDHFGGCCAACGRPPGLWHTLSADHWIPISSSDCPGTVPWNIVPLCYGADGCNNSKRNRIATEWLAERFGKRKGAAIQRRIDEWLEGRRKPT